MDLGSSSGDEHCASVGYVRCWSEEGMGMAKVASEVANHKSRDRMSEPRQMLSGDFRAGATSIVHVKIILTYT